MVTDTPIEIGIAHIATQQNFGQRMAQHLADAQLALRRTEYARNVTVTAGHFVACRPRCFEKLSMRNWIGPLIPSSTKDEGTRAALQRALDGFDLEALR